MNRIQSICGPALTLTAVVVAILALTEPLVKIGVDAVFQALGY